MSSACPRSQWIKEGSCCSQWEQQTITLDINGLEVSSKFRRDIILVVEPRTAYWR